MFLKLATGDHVNLAAVAYVKQYNDPDFGRLYRLFFTEQVIFTVSGTEDVKKIEMALDGIDQRGRR